MRRLPSCIPLPGQLIGSLETYCSEHFGWLQCSEIAHIFAELQRLRDAAVASLTPKSGSEEAEARLIEYGSLLRAVSSRLSGKPPGAPPGSVLRLQLPWLCALFSPISSIPSGSSSLWGGKGGTCQAAASLFTLAESLALSAQSLSADARAFAAFSLAHAQSVCYEVASRESMSLTFRSKLAAHASTLFAAAAEGLQAAQQKAPAEASLMPSLQRSGKATEAVALEGWSEELCFTAVAHLQLALQQKEIAEAEGDGFGMLVARITLAEEFLCRAEAEASAAATRTPGAPRLQTARLRAAVDALLRGAKRDNQLVYMEPVPPASAIPPLEESSCLRGTSAQVSLQELLPPNERAEQQLSALLPAGIRALADEYQALFQTVTAQVNTEANDLLSEVATFLQAQHLPDALRSRLRTVRQAQHPQVQQTTEKQQGNEQQRLMQRGQYGWCDDQEQMPPPQRTGNAGPAVAFEFSTACSHELLSVQSLGGAQRLRQQQVMLQQLSVDAATQLATVQHQLQSQLQLLQQQQKQQQDAGPTEFNKHQQQQLADLEVKTRKLLDCASLYTEKLQQAQQANEIIGSRVYAALGPLRLPSAIHVSQKDGAPAAPTANAAVLPTLEQILCVGKDDAEQLVQKVLLHLQGYRKGSKQQQLVQQHLDAAHAALVGLESCIYTLQEDQHKLCQSSELLPDRILQQLRQAAAAATSSQATPNVCTAAASSNLRGEVARQLELAKQRWMALLSAETASNELQQQLKRQQADELQQVVQQQAQSLRKAVSEQQQGIAFFSQLQEFLHQLQQHQKQLLSGMHACIRSAYVQQQEQLHQLKHKYPQEAEHEEESPEQIPPWPTTSSLDARSCRSSNSSSVGGTAHWRRYSTGALIPPSRKPRRLSSNSTITRQDKDPAAAFVREPCFPNSSAQSSFNSKAPRTAATTTAAESSTGASFALMHSPIRPRSTRHSKGSSGTSPSIIIPAAPAPWDPPRKPPNPDTVFGGGIPFPDVLTAPDNETQ
ncbi:uncharacterized protein LOC34618899 [Cyclospora cayetanensis]|uniref:Uncharacterized protein LOC34618899 n=1 Tax=Cyclospora cayetanensis TaxID=88456 RepID=A0A6P6RWL3_9EIME|nr:uncharacterized protein LOC34618899 [Cyclospora cayetanensis]